MNASYRLIHRYTGDVCGRCVLVMMLMVSRVEAYSKRFNREFSPLPRNTVPTWMPRNSLEALSKHALHVEIGLLLEIRVESSKSCMITVYGVRKAKKVAVEMSIWSIDSWCCV